MFAFQPISTFLSSLGLVAAMLGACSYTPAEGALCSPSSLCPENQTCAQDGRCYSANELPVDAAQVDAQVDAGCPGTSTNVLADICLDAEGPLLLPSDAYSYDTDTAALLNSAGDAVPHQTAVVMTSRGRVHIVASSEFSLPAGATLTVTGALPLVVFGTEKVTIAGVLDVGSNRDNRGPGNHSMCAGSAGGPGVGDSAAGGGGAGGSAQFSGGEGGMGEGGSGGTAGPPQVDLLLLPGCPGGDGGSGTGPSTNENSGGTGGGVILLVSEQLVAIESSGSVFAGGAGGDLGPTSEDGGGGGGAGGVIVLDGQAVRVDGAATAHGGGGGAHSMPGESGARRETPQGGTAASGSGGIGGTTGAGAMGSSSGISGGGGGGGGAGGVWIHEESELTANGLIAPAQRRFD